MKARFWIWHNGDAARLSLADGQHIVVSSGGATEEGYHCEDSEYWRDGDMVYRIVDTHARDCDGRLDTHTELFCRIDALDAHVVLTDGAKFAYKWPAWHRAQYPRSYQRDYSAEAMGY